MKRTALIAITAIFLFSGTICFAQSEQPQGRNSRTGDQKSGMMPGNKMMGHGMMASDKMPDMDKMMKKQMVATSDGGIVVLVHDTLYKYDSELNLEKQVEIPIDYEQMKDRMQKMRRMSPSRDSKSPGAQGDETSSRNQ